MDEEGPAELSCCCCPEHRGVVGGELGVWMPGLGPARWPRSLQAWLVVTVMELMMVMGLGCLQD